MSTAIGVDLGGTKIAAGVVDPAGALLATTVRPTPPGGGRSALLDAIAAAVVALPGHETAVGIGVGTGGVVDRSRGVVVSASSLLPGWSGTAVADELQARLARAVVVDNDANAFALGEHVHGAGGRADSGVYVTVGTGVGGAIVLGGSLWRGASWTAGELGHVPVPGAEGRTCPCGGVGHLETVAAGPAIARRYHELTGEQIDLREVVARRDVDPRARAVLAEGAGALGRALAGVANAIDPARVVVGGGVADAGPGFWSPLREAFAAELLHGRSAPSPVAATLGPRAAVIGAAALLREAAPATIGSAR